MKLEPSDLEAIMPLIQEAVSRGVAAALANVSPQPTLAERLLWSEKELADSIGVAEHVLTEQRKRGKISFLRGAGNRVWYRKEDIDAYIASCAMRAANENESPDNPLNGKHQRVPARGSNRN